MDVSQMKIEKEVWLGGTGEMYLVSDGEREYLFKPAFKKFSKTVQEFRAYAQEAAYKVQKIVDPASAIECEVVTLDGMFGAVQERIDINRNQTSDIIEYQLVHKRLNEEHLRALIREYITDYLLCNYNAHGYNFIIDTNGILRGIDKEQSFKYIMEENSDDPTFSTNFNTNYGTMPVIYQVMFRDFENGELSAELLDTMDEYVKRVNSVTSEEYLEIFKKYAESLNPNNPEIILSKIVQRKENLEKVVESLKQRYQQKDKLEKQQESSEEKNLENVINKAFKSPDIVRLLKSYEPQSEEYGKKLSQTINYCILLHTTDGLIDFLEEQDTEEQFKILERKVSSRLGINPEDMETRKEEIYKYIYNTCKKDGFVYHTTNSVAGNQIRKEGMSGVNRPWDQNEILDMHMILKKYGIESILGWLVLDMTNKPNSWFYDFSPIHVKGYSESPEWLAHFCGEGTWYYKLIPDEDMHPYVNKDYETAKKNIEQLQKAKGMSEDDSKIMLEFFNKYWKIFENATPELVMIPRKSLGLYEGKDPYNDTTNAIIYQCKEYPVLMGDKTVEEHVKASIIDLVLNGKEDINCYFNETVPPENLIFVDLSELLKRKKIMREEKNQAVINFGKHDQIPYDEAYEKHLKGRLGGFDDAYHISFKYKSVNSEKAKEIRNVVSRMNREGVGFYQYLIDENRLVTINDGGAVGGFYCYPKFLDGIIEELSKIDELEIVGLEESKAKESETEETKKKEADELEEIFDKIKGFDSEKRKIALELFRQMQTLEKDEKKPDVGEN